MRFFILILLFPSFNVSAQVKVDPYVSPECRGIIGYADGYYEYKGKEYNLGGNFSYCEAKDRILDIIENEKREVMKEIQKQNEIKRKENEIRQKKTKKLNKKYLNCLMKNIKANSTDAHKNVIELFCKDKVYN